MAQILLPREDKLGLLKTYIYNSKLPRDQLTTSNSIFVAQKKLDFPVNYADFSGFGKLGVSSKTLGHDYIHVSLFWDVIEPKQTDPALKQIRDIAKILSKFTKEDLRLLSCLLFYGEKGLCPSERKKARMLLRNLVLKTKPKRTTTRST